MVGKSKDRLMQELAKQLKVLRNKGACTNYPTLEQFQKHGGVVLLTREIKADGKVGYLSDDAFEALGEAANIVWGIVRIESALMATEEEIYKECKKFVGQQLLNSCDLKGGLLIEHVCDALSVSAP